MKSLQKFESKKVFNAQNVIGNGFVHTNVVMLTYSYLDVYHDDNGNGVLDGNEAASFSWALAKK
jgi:hypothetical protein